MQRLVVMIMVLRGALAVAPVFVVPDPDPTKDANKIYMSELLAQGDLVKTLSATDVDTDDETLTFSIAASTPVVTTDAFLIDGNQLKVKTTVIDAFDYENEGTVLEYDIVLSVSDGTESTDLTTTIIIQDANDVQPVFSGTMTYVQDVLDSTEGGTSVYKFEATDGDGTVQNNQITYAISSGPAEFVVDPTSGIVSTAANVSFDPQVTPRYQMTVTATDNGIPPLADAVILYLTIVSKPLFDNLVTAQTTSVNENVPENHPVFTLQVSDKDTPTSELTISIRTQSTPEMFKIADGNLVQTTNSGLDAEEQQTYDLVFEVSDGTYTSVSQVLTVTVNDLNDNTPSITAVSAITIPENTTVGIESTVVDIEATDLDVSDINNQLTYSIIDGDSDSIFDIVPTTGLIHLAQTPRSMTVNQYTLTIRVSDNGTPIKAATIDVDITINPDTVDECEDNPCMNGVTCTSYLNEYACECVLGYEGKNCETNIEDCMETSCKNGGTCVDGLRTFTCNCAPGYTGGTCTDECTGNMYGSGCTQPCNCNASRLIENVGTQICNHVDGTCKCDTSAWTGNDCNTDVDECTDQTICSSVPNKVCENTPGSYYCTCKTGYAEDTGGTCTSTTSGTTLVAGANELQVDVTITLDKPCIKRDIPSKFKTEENALEGMMRTIVRPVKRVDVYDIICGSETFDSVIIIDNTDAAKELLAKDLQTMRDGATLSVDGVDTRVVTMTVDGKPLRATTSGDIGTNVCAVYTAYVTCPSGKECRYEDGAPFCRDTDDDDDNLGLILGLSLGLGVPLLLAVVIGIMVCCLRYIRSLDDDSDYAREKRYSRRPYWDSYSYPRDTRRNYYPEYNEYVDKRDFYDLSPSEKVYQRY